MPTTVHHTTTQGSLGELQAGVIFTEIGWAPPAKLGEDIGTDLITFARGTSAADEKADSWDLGAPVLLQVKSSDTAYAEPASERKGELGWWFAESDTYHFDHWLSFGLPYLLVLVDTRNQIGYWAEITGDAIVPTGKGRKIFVPAEQKVDKDGLEALTRVAISRRKYSLEGSVWNGTIKSLAPADRLRHALVVPRRVAPHPNRPITELTFEEAAAMVMRNRYPELARGLSGVHPKAEDWATSKDWGWRFVHALGEIVYGGSSAALPELTTKARHRFERDALLVLQACVAYIGGDTEAAVEVLTPTRTSKPADRGWLLVQKAAFLLELDKPAEATEAAKAALIATNILEGDLSVSAIRGAAVSVIFSAAGFGAEDPEASLGAVITAQDNAGNWWRAQEVSWALERDLGLRFDAWTSRGSTRAGRGTARDDVATIAWNAAFTGAWGSWRQLIAMDARLALTSTTDTDQVAAALASLVFVGEKQAAKDAARRVWRDGPIESLARLVNALAYQPWAKRAEGATMAVLAEGGDLLVPAAADHVVQRIIDLISTDGDIRVHGRAWSYRWSEADGTLNRVLRAATKRMHRKVAGVIAADFAACADSMADAYMRVAIALTTADLGSSHLNRLFEAAVERQDHYGIDMLEVIAADSSAAFDELRKRAKAGDSRAVRALLVAGSTDRGDFIQFGRSEARTVRGMVADAQGAAGTVKISGFTNDPLDDLTLAAINSGDTRLWKAVTDALEACVIEETQQQVTVRRLARRFTSLPPLVQRRLVKLAPKLRGTNVGVSLGGHNDFAAAVTNLRIASGVIPDLEVEAILLRERRENPLGFARTLGAWNSNRKLPFLATMVVDEDPMARGQAAFSIIEHADHYPDDRVRAFAVIQSALLQDEGGALPDAVAQGLASFPAEEFVELEEGLRKHPSALVRGRFL